MTPERTWHAVHTRPGCEKKVSQLLANKNIECYCALTRSTQSPRDKGRVFHSLFTSYVFVLLSEADQETVKRTRGVLNFVYWLSKPVVIREEEIQAIKHFVHEYENVKLEQIKVNATEKVTEASILFGEGNAESKRQSIRVTLPSLGFAMVADVRVGSVEVIQQHKGFVAQIA